MNTTNPATHPVAHPVARSTFAVGHAFRTGWACCWQGKGNMFRVLALPVLVIALIMVMAGHSGTPSGELVLNRGFDVFSALVSFLVGPAAIVAIAAGTPFGFGAPGYAYGRYCVVTVLCIVLILALIGSMSMAVLAGTTLGLPGMVAVIGSVVSLIVVMYIWTRLWFSMTAAVIDNSGPLAAIRAGWRASQGKFWRIAALTFIAALAGMLLGFAAGIVFGFASSYFTGTAAQILSVLAAALALYIAAFGGALLAACGAAAYCQVTRAATGDEAAD